MAMRRGHHTSRVLKALGTGNTATEAVAPGGPQDDAIDASALPDDEKLPTEFDEA
jgi:hypothetical protein